LEVVSLVLFCFQAGEYNVRISLYTANSFWVQSTTTATAAATALYLWKYA
jgi:hypothetical protein